MRKLLYLLTIGVVAGCMAACDDDDDGTFGEKIDAVLEINSVTPHLTPDQPIALVRDASAPTDTTYIYYYTKRDTIRLADGTPEILPDGSMHIVTEKIEYEGPIRAKYFVYEPVVVANVADTLDIAITSNSRWTVGTLVGTGIGCTNTKGGGDGGTSITLQLNRSTTARRTTVAYIYTNDSTVMHKVTFEQKKRNEQ